MCMVLQTFLFVLFCVLNYSRTQLFLLIFFIFIFIFLIFVFLRHVDGFSISQNFNLGAPQLSTRFGLILAALFQL